ncbi:MAG: chitobiase/beta-hexosaminidase C-terminal domain-containing protein [Paludibacteraceae bacterium]|nr:chitobiase/beta-hexosaminidase C-terminal domain-containing protein [Paludibacteraceae bacterium]
MKKLTLLMSALLIGVVAFAADAPKVTLDFSTASTASAWNFGTTKLKADKEFTNGTYTIKMIADTKNGYGIYSEKEERWLLMGKTNAALQLPAFDFAVSKIIVYGQSAASTNVKFNILAEKTEDETTTYVAVSTEAQDAQKDHTFLISSDYQAAGNIYRIKVTNSYNTRISKIEIYEAVAGAPANVEFSLEGQAYIEQKVLTLSCPTDGASIYYTTNGTEPSASSTLYDGAITVDQTMTVKAVAIKNGVSSEVITKTITIVSTEGQGTKENPFTIADAKLLNDKYPGAHWVIGRIIGVFEENVPVVVDATAGTETVANLAITDGTDTIAVQLLNGSDIRTALNLKDHKEFVGRDIKVHGEILSYFQRAGIKNTDDYDFDGISTALEEETATEQKDMKLIENGQVIIIRNGARYSITGVELK